MILSLLQFALGIGLLVGGAWVLVGGGTRIAGLLGIPAVVVGLTVVAFGTSAPELFVSLVGALRGNTGLVLGNVVGSNVANLGLILAVAALLRPVRVERALIRREVPLLVGVTILFALLLLDGTLSRLDAGVLVVLFVAFIVRTIRGGDRGAPVIAPLEVPRPPEGRRLRGLVVGTGMVVAGVCCLAGGGHLIVVSALDMAARLGVSETLVGLTLVAVGTSLPELATTIVAGVRREDDLALGNIVGSNLFNILAVAGPVGLVRPLADTSGGIGPQFMGMVALTLLVAVLLATGHGSLGRGRGGLLLAIYIGIVVVWTLP